MSPDTQMYPTNLQYFILTFPFYVSAGGLCLAIFSSLFVTLSVLSKRVGSERCSDDTECLEVCTSAL